MLVDVMSEKIQFANTKETLVRVDYNPMCGEALENNSQVLEVLFRSGTGDEDVVDVSIGKGRPQKTWSMNRWKVCAAFLRPKGIRTNSNRPNGVVMAVLGMSSGATGIWWYARTRSSLEKTVAP